MLTNESHQFADESSMASRPIEITIEEERDLQNLNVLTLEQSYRRAQDHSFQRIVKVPASQKEPKSIFSNRCKVLFAVAFMVCGLFSSIFSLAVTFSKIMARNNPCIFIDSEARHWSV